MYFLKALFDVAVVACFLCVSVCIVAWGHVRLIVAGRDSDWFLGMRILILSTPFEDCEVLLARFKGMVKSAYGRLAVALFGQLLQAIGMIARVYYAMPYFLPWTMLFLLTGLGLVYAYVNISLLNELVAKLQGKIDQRNQAEEEARQLREQRDIEVMKSVVDFEEQQPQPYMGDIEDGII